jgi:hypothetical protein
VTRNAFKRLSPLRERKIKQIPAVPIKQIEHVVDDGVLSLLPILEFLKPCSPHFIQGDDLAIEHEAALPQVF